VALAPVALAGSSGSTVETQPSPAEIAQAQADVGRLRARLKQQAADADHAQLALRAAAELAGQALESAASAVQRLQAAQAVEDRTQTALEAAQDQAAARHRELGQWASQAYQGGSDLALDPTLNALLSTDGLEGFGTTLETLRRIGRIRDGAADAADSSAARASVAADTAAIAGRRAADAAVRATSARQAADAAVQTQSQLVGVAESQESSTREKVSAALKHADELQDAAATAAAGPGSAATRDNRVTGTTGSCRSTGIQQYGNGQIPVAALCGLKSAPGQYLRADAAYAFDRLSYAYQQQFGTPVCVTDSYRSYPEQVRLYATKPGLAAVPGTSNHGWGTAVDLCGGIQSFGTRQHTWMLLNAPLYGWFHPSWAEPAGSRPEPWHWEYGGG
jgi:LAS superfamily LD-carboxypeptidase LdcB